jgi:hypothetical protein
MISAQLIEKVRKVPSYYEKEIEDFIDAILHSQLASRPKSRRQFGLLKGKLIMAPDFDEPLEDFKDYES